MPDEGMLTSWWIGMWGIRNRPAILQQYPFFQRVRTQWNLTAGLLTRTLLCFVNAVYVFHVCFGWINFESMKWGQGYKALVKNSKTHKCIYCKHTCREMWNKKAKENETLTWVSNSHIPMHGLSEGCWEDKVIKLKLFHQMTWCLDCFMFYGRPSLDCIKSMHLPSPLSKSRKTHLYVPPM